MPEQEHSIKERSHALFVEEELVATPVPTKPFEVYLRETPARPLSPGVKAIFWVLGIIVGVLFLLALWRLSHHHTRRPPAAEEAPAASEEAPATTGMLREPRGSLAT
jgi:hypothetical protein